MTDATHAIPTVRMAGGSRTELTGARVAVIGGYGRVGLAVCDLLWGQGAFALEYGRENQMQWPADAPSWTHVVNCASIQLNSGLFATLSRRNQDIKRVVLVGSTRAYTTIEDGHARQIRNAADGFEQLCERWPWLRGVYLMPSMIYGGGDHNVARIDAWLRRCRYVPLPNHGYAMIQPVHYQDVAKAIVAALTKPAACGKPIIVAGPQAMPIAELVHRVGNSIGVRPRVVDVPAQALHLAAAVSRVVPGMPSIGRYQVSRLLEDRAFDIEPMRKRLGVEPRGFVWPA